MKVIRVLAVLALAVGCIMMPGCRWWQPPAPQGVPAPPPIPVPK